MKNTAEKIFFLLIIFASAFTSPAQTGMVVADNGSFVPVALIDNSSHQSAAAAGVCDSITSTFAAGNGHRGNMFDITAANTVTIMSFDGYPKSNTNYEIYYKAGTYLGYEPTAGAWILAGSATGVVAQPIPPTPLPIALNVTIPAGQTYAFYVSSSNIAIEQYYSYGTTAGNVYASDANISFKEGCGLEYPFTAGTGITFTPRVWNGRIHYCTPTGIGELNTTAQNLNTYPNPMVENSTIKMNTALDNGIIRIFDVVGKEVNVVSSINASEITIAKDNLSPGMYFFLVTDNNGYRGTGKVSIR